VLFGNIRAERVYSCFRGQNRSHNSNQAYFCRENNPEAVEKGLVGSCSSDADKSLEVKEKNYHNKNTNFHLIWLVLLKILLQQGKNSPLKFEATVNTSLDTEHGKFEMLSVSVPCARNKLFSGWCICTLLVRGSDIPFRVIINSTTNSATFSSSLLS